MWTKKLAGYQGWDIKCDVVFQGNTSTIKLLSIGRESLGKRSRHFDLRLICAKDLIGNDEVQVACCLTERMITGHNNKPLAVGKFKILRKSVLNLSGTHQSQVERQELVGYLTKKSVTGFA